MTMLIPIRDDNPYKRFPLVTIVLIALNVWVFLNTGPVDETAAFRYGAVPCDVIGRCAAFSDRLERTFPNRLPLLSLFTSMFMHGSIAHIAGNMLFLWVFGNNVEDRLGHLKYTAFYVVCGLAAAFGHIFVSSSSPVPIVGASGAVSGVLGAYFVMFPRARVLSLVPFLFFLPVEVSAGFLLGMWFVMQLLASLAGIGLSQGAGVAFMAHVAGFVAGWVIVRIMAPRARRHPDAVDRWLA